jgi:hypothetical protein
VAVVLIQLQRELRHQMRLTLAPQPGGSNLR